MRHTVTIAIAIDALSWPAVEKSGFLREQCPFRRPVRTILGYSSAAIPSILTGQLPQVHGRWSYLYYDPAHSPFAWTRWLNLAGPLLHNRLADNPLLKRLIARWTARRHGFDGYFPVYDFPLRYLHLMDHCSKRWDFRPGAFDCPSLVDVLDQHGVPARFLTYPMPEEEIFQQCAAALRPDGPRLLFLYLASVDALGHAGGPDSPAILARLQWYERRIEELRRAAETAGVHVNLLVFSDHGMVPVRGTVDLRRRVEALGLRFGVEYVAVYDSTMARFWYPNPECRPRIREVLQQCQEGRLLTGKDKTRYGIAFAGDRYGQDIFLLQTGLVIHPSHMSRRVLYAMHGYDPDDRINDGIFLASERPAIVPEAITDLFALLLRAVGLSSPAEVKG